MFNTEFGSYTTKQTHISEMLRSLEAPYKTSYLRVLIDLPLINEDTGIFRDEIAIEGRVFTGATNTRKSDY